MRVPEERTLGLKSHSSTIFVLRATPLFLEKQIGHTEVQLMN